MDRSTVIPGNHGLHREITVKDTVPGLYLRLGTGSTIENPTEGLYLMDDKSYYIQMDGGNTSQPIIRDAAGRKELIVPVTSKLSYSILF